MPAYSQTPGHLDGLLTAPPQRPYWLVICKLDDAAPTDSFRATPKLPAAEPVKPPAAVKLPSFTCNLTTRRRGMPMAHRMQTSQGIAISPNRATRPQTFFEALHAEPCAVTLSSPQPEAAAAAASARLLGLRAPQLDGLHGTDDTHHSV